MLFLTSSMRLIQAGILPFANKKIFFFSSTRLADCTQLNDKITPQIRYIGLSRISLRRHCGFPQVSSSAPGNTKLFSVLLWIVITVVILPNLCLFQH